MLCIVQHASLCYINYYLSPTNTSLTLWAECYEYIYIKGHNICQSNFFPSTKRHYPVCYDLVGCSGLAFPNLTFCRWPWVCLFSALVIGDCPFHPQLFSLECSWTEACLFFFFFFFGSTVLIGIPSQYSKRAMWPDGIQSKHKAV